MPIQDPLSYLYYDSFIGYRKGDQPSSDSGDRMVDLGISEDTYGLLFIGILAGAVLMNMGIVMVFIMKKRYRRPYHMAYLNRATTDLILAIYGAAIRGPAIRHGIPNEEFCEICQHISIFITLLNFLSIIPLTTDRIVAVFLPFKYQDPSRLFQLKQVIVGLWLIPAFVLSAISLSSYIAGGQLTSYESGVCKMSQYWNYEVFFFFLFAMCYLLPFLFNVIAYTAIVLRLQSRNRTTCMRHVALVIRACLICMVFSISWIPHTYFYISYRYFRSPDLYHHYFWFAQSFLYINTIFDPPLYVLTEKVATKVVAKVMKFKKSLS